MEGRKDFLDIYRTFRTHWSQVDPFLLELFTDGFPSENRMAFNFAHKQSDNTVLVGNGLVRN